MVISIQGAISIQVTEKGLYQRRWYIYIYTIYIPQWYIYKETENEGSKMGRKIFEEVFVVQSLSHAKLCNPWTVAHQASVSMGFPRQEYLSGLPFPSPGDLPDPGTESASPALQVDSLPLSHQGSPFEEIMVVNLPNLIKDMNLHI